MPRALRPSFRLLLLLLVLLGSRGPLQAGPPGTRYPVAGHEKPVALLHAGREIYLVTEQSVFRLEHRQFVRRYRSAAPIQRALATDTSLWLGTRRGVELLDLRRLTGRHLSLPIAADSAHITALFRDATGAVWLGADGYGVFRLAGSGPEQMLSTPAINAGLATADKLGVDWHQHRPEPLASTGSGRATTRRAWPTTEIPDNLVEQLLPDNRGNLWVLMSAGVSVFAGGGAAPAAELPTVKFIGRPGNAVRSVAYAAGTGYLFATDMGLLLLPDQGAGAFERFEPTSDKVEDKALLVALAAPAAAPALAQVDVRQRVWLAAPDAVTVLTAKEFRQYVRAARAR